MNGNKVSAPVPNVTKVPNVVTSKSNDNTMMYIGIGVLLVVIIVIIVIFVYMNNTSKNSDTTVSAQGSTNVLTELSIDSDDFTLQNNKETGNVEIVNKKDNKITWTSNSPGGDSVAWIIDKDGIFRVYHLNKTNNTWKSVKAAVVSDKTLTSETNGPYSYEFTNKGILSTYNKDKKLIWDTKSGQLEDDTNKTYSAGNTTITTLVKNSNASNANITLST